MENKIFGISGYARSGKDTFGECMVGVLSKYGIKAKTFALATQLKNNIDDFIFQEFGISSFTKDEKEKKIIRPLLVGYGEACRNANPNHWLNVIEYQTCTENFEYLPIITDIRYENEADWIIKNNGFILNINRKLPNGDYIEPANKEEEFNHPKVLKKCFFNLTWDTIENKNEIEEIVENFIISILEKEINLWKAIYPL